MNGGIPICQIGRALRQWLVVHEEQPGFVWNELMIFRLSQKLVKKINERKLPDKPLHVNVYADWSCHVFTANRTQYVILTNTASLYSCVMYGKGITDYSQFIERGLSAIRKFTADDGQQFIYRNFIAPATGTVSFAKALNRSVTGSMNDMIFHAKMWLIEEDLSPHDVGFKLNEIPMSALKYNYPRELFIALTNDPRRNESNSSGSNNGE